MVNRAATEHAEDSEGQQREIKARRPTMRVARGFYIRVLYGVTIRALSNRKVTLLHSKDSYT